jgi:hypothetical protein
MKYRVIERLLADDRAAAEPIIMNDPDAEGAAARPDGDCRGAPVGSEPKIKPNIEDDDAAGSALASAIATLAGDPSTARVADALRLWTDASDGIAFEDCLGLARTWRSARRRRRRDRLHKQIAMEHFPGLSGRPRANAIDRAIVNYEASWPRDRRSGNRRSGLPGLLFDLLALGAPPLGAASIRALLAKKSPGE